MRWGGVGLRMITRLCPAVRGQGLVWGAYHPTRARLEIWELPALRVLEVIGMVRTEGL